MPFTDFIDKHGFVQVMNLWTWLNRGDSLEEIASRFKTSRDNLGYALRKYFRKVYIFNFNGESQQERRQLEDLAILLNQRTPTRELASLFRVGERRMRSIIAEHFTLGWTFTHQARQLVLARLHREEWTLTERRKQFEAIQEKEDQWTGKAEKGLLRLIPKLNASKDVVQEIFNDIRKRLSVKQLQGLLKELADENSSNWKVAKKYQLHIISVTTLRKRLGAFYLYLENFRARAEQEKQTIQPHLELVQMQQGLN